MRFAPTMRGVAALVLVGSSGGCVGAIDGAFPEEPTVAPAAAGDRGNRASAGPGAGAAPTAPAIGTPSTAGATPAGKPGRVRLWRLTRQQYDNTVRDLLGDTSAPARAFAPDIGGTGFTNNAEVMGVAPAQAIEFNAAAARLAREAVTSRLSRVFPCEAAELGDDACARRFVETFGRRAFRRPLRTEEVGAYLGLYTTTRQNLDGATAVALVIETMLQSPHFLYRSELGEGAPNGQGQVMLTPFELATALSYLFWDTTPDEALAAAADAGGLATPAGLGEQARRLAADVRSRAPLLGFLGQVFDLDDAEHVTRDPKLVPNFPALLASMLTESRTFLERLLFEGDARLATLLTAPHGYVDANLARIYGVTRPAGSSGFVKVDLDPKRRAGMLTQAGFLTIHTTPGETSPPQRGKAVLVKMLCMDVPPPIDNIPEPPAPPGKETTRQKFERITAPADCSACHRVLNPLGFAFESYDTLGRFRTADNTLPVNTTVDLSPFPGMGGEVGGAVELIQRLAANPRVAECFARHTLRYALGRRDTAMDEQAVAAVLDRFNQSGQNLRELFVAFTATSAFSYRSVH